MNATVVLCHFCEQHGPSVVMCTQPYRQIQSRSQGTTHGNVGEHSVDSASSISRNTSHVGLYGVCAGELGVGVGGGVDSMVGAFAFGQENAPVSITSKNSPTTSQQLPVTTNPTCRACSFSSRDEPGLISQDQAAGMTFISTQWPKDQDLLAYVRVACQRSLSCEVFPEPEGAFYFGDEVNGHVVSYNFQVKDAQARGFQSRFSILVMCWDRVYLLTLWPFLISNLSRMVARIRSAAEHTYEMETSNTSHVSSGTIGGPSPSTHRAGTTMTNMYGARGATPPPPPAPIPLAFYGQAVAAGNAGPSGCGVMRQRRAADADMRSLADLTKDDQIFYRIHAWFTWLLRAGGRRWSVIPSLMTPPDEDVLIEQEERQAAIAAMGELTGGGQSHPVASHSGSSLSAAGATTGGLLNPAGLNLATSSDGLANQYPGLADVEDSTIALLVLTRMLYSLGEKAFGQLVQHIAVGNQIVVQPLHETPLGRLVVSACAKLLPRGCRKQVVLSPEYLPPFQCNLLSLTVKAVPPEPGWNPGDGVLFVTVVRSKSSSVSSSESAKHSALYEFVDSLHFKIGSILPSIDPLLASFRACNPAEFNYSAFQALSTSNSNQPISSTTTLSTYAQHVIKLLSLDPPLPSSSLDLALRATRQEWINRARLLYSFKRCQGPIMSAEETTRRWAAVLAAIDCTNVDNANVARFWQGALSHHSRQNTCHSRRRAPNSTSVSRKSSRCSSMVDMATVAMAANSLID